MVKSDIDSGCNEMRSIALLAIAVMCLLILSSVHGPEPVDAAPGSEPQWAMYRSNPQGTGLSKYNIAKNPGEASWSFEFHHSKGSSPVIASDGTIYFLSEGIRLYALNKDGSEKWRLKMDGTWFSKSMAIDSEGTIYFSTYERDGPSYFYSVDDHGKINWRVESEYDFRTAPVIGDDGTLYIANGDSLWAYNPDGTVKWDFRCWTLFNTMPALLQNGRIFYNQWIINPDGTEYSRFYVGSALDTAPTIGLDGTIYFGCRDNNFYAVNDTGSVLWKYNTRTTIRSSPAIGPNGMIYFGSSDSYLYAMEPNGRYSWSYKTGSTIYDPPVVSADGIILVSSADGCLYAINPEGTLKWKCEFLEGASAPAIGSDGTIYTASYGNFYAINKGSTKLVSPAGIILALTVIVAMIALILMLRRERSIYRELELINNFKK